MYAHAQQEPAVAVVFRERNADAFAVVRRNVPVVRFRVAFKRRNGALAIGAEILRGNGEAQLFFFLGFLQIGDETIERFALAAQLCRLNDNLRHQIGTVVKEVVLAQRRMAARLNRQRAVHALVIQAYRFVDDILVTALKAVVLAAERLLNVGLESVGRNGVRHNGAARVALQRNGGSNRHKTVAVDLFAAAVHSAAAIYVRVKNYAKVRTGLHGRRANARHGLLVLRVWNVVREAAVRLQKLAACNVRTKRLQHVVCVKTARAVAGVYNDFKARKRVRIIFRVHALADHLAQIICIFRHIVHRHQRAVVGLLRRSAVLCIFQNLGNIRAVKAARRREELQSVAEERVVARRNLHRAVARQLQNRHEHRRGRGKAAVVNRSTVCRKRAEQRRRNTVCGNAGVMADGNFQPLGALVQVLFAPNEKTGRNALHDLIGQVNRRAAAFTCNTANVSAAFQSFIGKHGKDLLFHFAFYPSLL